MHTHKYKETFTVLVYSKKYNYNSFTLNRHSTDIHSEVHKWKRNRNSTIKPAYHVQFNKISDDKVLVIRVNIDAFGMF
jgi:hypothetical protein